MTIDTTNPATGETIAKHQELDDAGIEAALDRARTQAEKWRAVPVDKRGRMLRSIGDAFEARREVLARQTTLEMGKTYKSALAEADKCVSAFRHFAKHGPSMLAPETYELTSGGRAETRWQPLGPVLAVMPWNFPMWQVVRFLVPCILAGNVGLLKHASVTMGVGEMLDEVVREGGAPGGLFQNLVISSDKVAGIIADDRVKAVTLTGSEGAGSMVGEAAGKALKKVVLELGGSDPFIVMPSADLDDAVSTAVKARIQNTGQSCICGKRMIVHADIHDEFRDRFIAAMNDVVAGDPFDDATDMGPLSSMDQLETVEKQLAAAKEAGATLHGGDVPSRGGAYIEAGVLEHVPLDSDVAREEIFGPIAMLFRADDRDDALRIANATPYGLGAAVFSGDAEEADWFAERIESGMVAINQMLASDPAAPFGGIKLSGHGRELSRHGLHEFMNLKTVLLDCDYSRNARCRSRVIGVRI
ncbi:NAD-dependent succinate-semialdehyde dehydrogenase [Sphingomicrobium clamense]|uniref:NAD-dependent succinate-semialdehyde dehydrogenase n=1 Tax=Sphingomicrobium clamense TaxID=2851013 RepID=A0ABS6V3M5_9SPHN|nr:NAD-dependent succinate-semialdehyde dehydrogenase [Sphingomicrobium sp. B8]MBW0144144.1 NAD-dependent succinate-semialdehyde dehydrogenase [Sphingomicrobium sp. B8]